MGTLRSREEQRPTHRRQSQEFQVWLPELPEPHRAWAEAPPLGTALALLPTAFPARPQGSDVNPSISGL